MYKRQSHHYSLLHSRDSHYSRESHTVRGGSRQQMTRHFVETQQWEQRWEKSCQLRVNTTFLWFSSAEHVVELATATYMSGSLDPLYGSFSGFPPSFEHLTQDFIPRTCNALHLEETENAGWVDEWFIFTGLSSDGEFHRWWKSTLCHLSKWRGPIGSRSQASEDCNWNDCSKSGLPKESRAERLRGLQPSWSADNISL